MGQLAVNYILLLNTVNNESDVDLVQNPMLRAATRLRARIGPWSLRIYNAFRCRAFKSRSADGGRCGASGERTTVGVAMTAVANG